MGIIEIIVYGGQYYKNFLIYTNMKYIYFGAEWCGPCKSIKPNVRSSDKSIQIVDVDTDPDMATQYGIRSVPSLIGIENGVAVERYAGAPSIMGFLTK